MPTTCMDGRCVGAEAATRGGFCWEANQALIGRRAVRTVRIRVSVVEVEDPVGAVTPVCPREPVSGG